jgi:cell division protein FtsZ
VPVPGEAVAVVIIGLAALLSLRLLIAVPGWIRHARSPETRAIRVVGVGGGGSNAVDRMVDARIGAASFVVCNTDAQALRRSSAETKIRIGEAITGGLGSGGNPEIGRRAAEEDEAKIARAVAGADLVFVTAGLGGGTGSGAAPIVAANARNQGALTIAVVTKPFGFEGSHRLRIAEAAAAELAANVDALIVVPNDRVADVLAEDVSMIDAFGVVDDVLHQAVQGIIDLITAPGLINLDFADVRSVMQDAGPALIGLGRGAGEHRATEAARQAIASPLLEASIEGARGILFNVSGPADLRLREVRQAAEVIRERADPEANVIFGASFSDSLEGDVLITLIATGLATPVRSATPSVEAALHEHARPVEDPPPPQDPPPLEEPPPVPASPAIPVMATSKRAARTATIPPKEVAAPRSHIQPRSAGGPELPDQIHARSSNGDSDDLDIPSFLRRGRRPTSQA